MVRIHQAIPHDKSFRCIWCSLPHMIEQKAPTRLLLSNTPQERITRKTMQWHNSPHLPTDTINQIFLLLCITASHGHKPCDNIESTSISGCWNKQCPGRPQEDLMDEDIWMDAIKSTGLGCASSAGWACVVAQHSGQAQGSGLAADGCKHCCLTLSNKLPVAGFDVGTCP